MVGRLLKYMILTVGVSLLNSFVMAQSRPSMEPGKVCQLTEETFAAVVADFKNNKSRYLESTPCVVDFYATWCQPCKKLSPTIDSLAAENRGSLRFFKVDVAQTPEIVRAYGLEYVPCFLFCKNGTVQVIREVNGDFRTYVERYFK